MALSTIWKMRLAAIVVLVIATPSVVGLLLSGELHVRAGRYSTPGNFLPLVAFVASALYLSWSFLMARLTSY